MDILENEPSLWCKLLPRLQKAGHKFDRGHGVVLSGAVASTGAARLCAKACLRMGAGLVTVFSPPSAVMVNAAHLTAIMLRSIKDIEALAAALEDGRITAVMAGPGMGVGAETRSKVEVLLTKQTALVLDADALTSFAETPELFFTGLRKHGCTVLTPHGGEFARLFEKPSDILGERVEQVKAASAKCGAVVLLKGAETVVGAPDGRAVINRHASPWLATAGSGDVLAGIIGGLLTQGMEPFDAACAGAWMHGDAGQRSGPGLISEDLPGLIPVVLASIHS